MFCSLKTLAFREQPVDSLLPVVLSLSGQALEFLDGDRTVNMMLAFEDFTESGRLPGVYLEPGAMKPHPCSLSKLGDYKKGCETAAFPQFPDNALLVPEGLIFEVLVNLALSETLAEGALRCKFHCDPCLRKRRLNNASDLRRLKEGEGGCSLTDSASLKDRSTHPILSSIVDAPCEQHGVGLWSSATLQRPGLIGHQHRGGRPLQIHNHYI